MWAKLFLCNLGCCKKFLERHQSLLNQVMWVWSLIQDILSGINKLLRWKIYITNYFYFAATYTFSQEELSYLKKLKCLPWKRRIENECFFDLWSLYNLHNLHNAKILLSQSYFSDFVKHTRFYHFRETIVKV